MIISKKEHISYYKYAPYAQRCEQKHEHNEGRIGKHKQELNGTYRDKNTVSEVTFLWMKFIADMTLGLN